jgi:NodT family efflux transporter outer membrane factor (OMF) lipoprotein
MRIKPTTIAPTTIAPSTIEAPRSKLRPCHAALHLTLVAFVLTAAGCATGFREYINNGFKVGPNYCPPAVPVAEFWIDYEDVRIKSEPPVHWQWWRVFNDPKLDELVDIARSENLTLREAGFRIAEARALRAIAAGNLLPQQQQAFGSYERRQLSREVGLVAGGAGPGLFDRTFSVWASGTQLAWELDFWGRFRRAVEVADANLDASVANYDDVLVILTSEVADTYVEIRTLQQRLRYARLNVKSQVGSRDIVTDRQEAGTASKLDVAQARTNLSQTEAIIPALETQLRQAQNQLCVLLGTPPQDLTALLGEGNAIPVAPAEVAVGIPADLIRRRPDIRRAEREVAAQSARIGIAEADLYPAFTINGSIFMQASDFADLFRSSAIAGSVGPSFNWNVLNYGRIRNRVVAEEAVFEQEVLQYQSVVLEANREAEDAIIAFLRAQRQAQILREGAAAALESRDLVRDLYGGGKADFGRVFVAEFFLVQQQDALATAEGNIARNLIAIYRALGGGWESPAEGEVMLVNPPPMNAPPPPPEEIPATPEPAPIP